MEDSIQTAGTISTPTDRISVKFCIAKDRPRHLSLFNAMQVPMKCSNMCDFFSFKVLTVFRLASCLDAAIYIIICLHCTLMILV